MEAKWRSGSVVGSLAERLKCDWPAIRQAEMRTEEQLAQLKRLFDEHRCDSDEMSVVAFGSIARREWTSGSDLDWTLLVDGRADPEHLNTAHKIQEVLKDASFHEPGLTGVFGNMAFSHDIIQNIGGQHDTNQNTTRRILLLLESAAIGANGLSHARVIRGVLNQYLREDTSFLTPDGQKSNVPRFLLNDIARFWRTMAVDFASKQRSVQVQDGGCETSSSGCRGS